MPKFSPRRLAQRSYEAFAAGDRKFFEQHLAEDFTFSSPLDVGLDRAGYFARCWPGAGHGQKFNFLRLIEHDDEVVVTYEMTKPNGEKGRNTEILRIKDNKIISVEVYFGWDVSPIHSITRKRLINDDCHVERSETSLIVSEGAIQKMTGDSSLRSE